MTHALPCLSLLIIEPRCQLSCSWARWRAWWRGLERLDARPAQFQRQSDKTSWAVPTAEKVPAPRARLWAARMAARVERWLWGGGTLHAFGFMTGDFAVLFLTGYLIYDLIFCAT